MTTRRWGFVAVGMFAALALVGIGGAIEDYVGTTPCQQAVEAADAVLATTGQALEASAAGHEASADDDVVGLLAATTTMSELTPTVTVQMQEYREAKEKCS